MPIYGYQCKECGHVFEKFCRTFESGEVNFFSCQSVKVERLLTPPLFRMGKISEPATEFSAKDAEVNYYKDRKDYDRAGKAAEKAGKSEWEVRDIYCKTGKKM